MIEYKILCEQEIEQTLLLMIGRKRNMIYW